MNYREPPRLSLIVGAALAAPAQVETTCAHKISQLPKAPELRGFHLGMTIDQVKDRIPQIEVGPADAFGATQVSVNPDFNPRIEKSTLQGVRTVSFEFLDGKLFSLGIGYNTSFKWQTLEAFLPEITRALGLPDAWQSKSWRGQVIECSDFQITVRMIGGSPSILLIDTATRREWEKRVAGQEEKDPSPL